METARCCRGFGLLLAVVSLAGCTAQHRAGPAQLGFFFQAQRAGLWLRAPHLQDPLAANGEAVEAGRDIYSNQCSNCHNADGKGTELGLNMYPGATDLTSRYAQGFSDRELYSLLWNGIGHTGMPKWDSQLQPNQIWQVIHYLRTMPGDSKPAAETLMNGDVLAQGRHLFKAQGCLECHSVEGKPADGPDLTYEGDRGHSRVWLIGHTIRPADYSPGSEMPAYGKMSGDDLNALAVFLNSLKKGNSIPNHNSGF